MKRARLWGHSIPFDRLYHRDVYLVLSKKKQFKLNNYLDSFVYYLFNIYSRFHSSLQIYKRSCILALEPIRSLFPHFHLLAYFWHPTTLTYLCRTSNKFESIGKLFACRSDAICQLTSRRRFSIAHTTIDLLDRSLPNICSSRAGRDHLNRVDTSRSTQLSLF